ncbi:MAG: hypothetical protein PWP03_76 [Candidatus Woesearchaeota archaeon]|nr:hypothetical protein [Candidatus Woesearchaeota archaeon]MDN5327438.1 hypothetical protein [Candidatus Woesearchaeota archaeon]
MNKQDVPIKSEREVIIGPLIISKSSPFLIAFKIRKYMKIDKNKDEIIEPTIAMGIIKG